MKYFLIISIIFLALFPIILSKVISKRMMYNIYYTIVDSYEDMMLARKAYYQARFIEDEIKRKELQDASHNLYAHCASFLNSEFVKEHVEKMPTEMREECLDKISSSQYGLF